jgi:FdhE protein
MTQDVWLARHPYLRSVADFHAGVATAAASVPSGSAKLPNWDDYIGDYRAGIPLLRSSHVAIDFEPAETVLVWLVENLTSRPLPEKLAAECQDSKSQLRGEMNAPHRAVAWLFDNEDFKPAHPGLIRYLGWTALAVYLRPLLDAFSNWREEEHWLCEYCPTCGSPPAMGECGYFLAAVAARAGDTGESDARSANTETIIGSPLYRSRESHTFASTTVIPATLI